MSFFGSKGSASGVRADSARTQRHSSGWAHLAGYLRSDESRRILDVGPTSAGNINFITQMGHSVYMANLVEEAARPEWTVPAGPDGEEATVDVERFLDQNLDFAGRHFETVLLWDTLDYLPESFVQPLVDRLYQAIEPGGHLLAFFHAKAVVGADTAFSRYHLTETDQVQIQRSTAHPILRSYTNRQVEQVFKEYSAYKFFLAKDALREVIVTR